MLLLSPPRERRVPAWRRRVTAVSLLLLASAVTSMLCATPFADAAGARDRDQLRRRTTARTKKSRAKRPSGRAQSRRGPRSGGVARVRDGARSRSRRERERERRQRQTTSIDALSEAQGRRQACGPGPGARPSRHLAPAPVPGNGFFAPTSPWNAAHPGGGGARPVVGGRVAALTRSIAAAIGRTSRRSSTSAATARRSTSSARRYASRAGASSTAATALGCGRRLRQAFRSRQVRAGQRQRRSSHRLPALDGLASGSSGTSTSAATGGTRLGRRHAERLGQPRATTRARCGRGQVQTKAGTGAPARHEPSHRRRASSRLQTCARDASPTRWRQRSRRMLECLRVAGAANRRQAATTRTACRRVPSSVSIRPSTSICCPSPPIAKLVANAAQDYGIIVRDATVRRSRSSAKDPTTAGPLIDVGSYKTLAGFPWDQPPGTRREAVQGSTLPP